jgi:hypothetical protein
MGWGGLDLGRDFFFYFIVCGEGEMLMGLVVLVDTCQHGEAGDLGGKIPRRMLSTTLFFSAYSSIGFGEAHSQSHPVCFVLVAYFSGKLEKV